MSAYSDYSFYTGTYLGSAIASADYARLSLRASEIIDRITFQRAPDDTENPVAIKMAEAAIADIFYDIEQSGGISGVVSERIGSHQVTYGADAQKTADERYTEAAAIYLENTGLLYQGFADNEYGAVGNS